MWKYRLPSVSVGSMLESANHKLKIFEKNPEIFKIEFVVHSGNYLHNILHCIKYYKLSRDYLNYRGGYV